jgi:hypothetical protein
VLAAVDFNDEPQLLTNKVDNEWPDRDLSPEAKTIEAMRSQRRPQTPLCIRHIMT